MTEDRRFAKGHNGNLRLDDTYVEIQRQTGMIDRATRMNRKLYGGPGQWETKRIPYNRIASLEFRGATKAAFGLLKIVRAEEDDAVSRRAASFGRLIDRLPGGSSEVFHGAMHPDAVTFKIANQREFEVVADELRLRLRQHNGEEALQRAAAQVTLDAAEAAGCVTDEHLLVPCPACGAPCVAPVSASAWLCLACARHVQPVHCSGCKRGYLRSVDPATKQPLGSASCPYCRRDVLPDITTFSAITNESKDLALPGDGPGGLERLMYRGRRVIRGHVLHLEGVSGIAIGQCAVVFDEREVVLSTGARGGAVVRIPFADLRGLQVAGRGEVVTVTDPGVVGGGFGTTMGGAAWGALKGAAMAAVINDLLSVTRRDIETIVHCTWQGGQITLLNDELHPETLAAILDPVTRRIESSVPGAAHTDAPPDRESRDPAARLRQLASLREEGIISEEDFQAQKARLLDEF